MRTHLNRFHAAVVALGASATLLVGCGGSTVSSDDVASETSAAPRESAPAEESMTEEPTTESSEASGTASAPSQGAGAAAPAPEDRGAREISEIPEEAPAVSPEDEEFLGVLADGGLDINGVEDQLLGTASTVCSEGVGSEVTAPAVAGQLIEQNRTELSHEEVTSLIVDNARATYCP